MFLLKIGSSKNINSFLNEGIIYINTLSSYKEMPCDSKLRSDPNENLTEIFQRKDIKSLTIECPETGKVLLTEKNLQGHMKWYNPYRDKERTTHAYCMSHIYRGMVVREDGKVFDERISEFGDSIALILKPQTFFDRIRVELLKLQEEGVLYSWKAAPIEYVCPDEHSGKMGAFRKFKEYEWQVEYRIALSANSKEPIILKLGDLSDIVTLIDMKKFKNSITAQPDGSHVITF